MNTLTYSANRQWEKYTINFLVRNPGPLRPRGPVSGVAIGGSAGSRNRAPTVTGPDRGHNNIYSNYKTQNTGFRRNRNPRELLTGSFKDPCLLLSDFCFLKHSQTHPTKRLWFQPLSTSMQTTSPMTSSVQFWLSVLVPQNVSKRHKRTTRMLKNFSTLLVSSI